MKYFWAKFYKIWMESQFWKWSSLRPEKDAVKQKVLYFQEDGQNAKWWSKSNLPLSQTAKMFPFKKVFFQSTVSKNYCNTWTKQTNKKTAIFLPKMNFWAQFYKILNNMFRKMILPTSWKKIEFTSLSLQNVSLLYIIF